VAKEEPREGEQSASLTVRERHEVSLRAQDQRQKAAPAPETCGYILSPGGAIVGVVAEGTVPIVLGRRRPPARGNAQKIRLEPTPWHATQRAACTGRFLRHNERFAEFDARVR